MNRLSKHSFQHDLGEPEAVLSSPNIYVWGNSFTACIKGVPEPQFQTEGRGREGPAEGGNFFFLGRFIEGHWRGFEAHYTVNIL
jgi:hypothetical protein